MRRVLRTLGGGALVALALVSVSEVADAASYRYTGPAVAIPDGANLSGS